MVQTNSAVTGETVAQPIAVYRTEVPGQRVFVGSEYPEAKATGGFLYFMPIGERRAHPLAVGDTIQTEGVMVVKSPELIKILDALCETGNVPFERHPNPTLIDDMPDVGVKVGG